MQWEDSSLKHLHLTNNEYNVILNEWYLKIWYFKETSKSLLLCQKEIQSY